jgi:hypothetical protein
MLIKHTTLVISTRVVRFSFAYISPKGQQRAEGPAFQVDEGLEKNEGFPNI